MQPIGKLVELGYVVRNFQPTMDFFRSAMGVDDFVTFERLKMDNVRYMGRPTRPQIDIALGASGDIVIELVRQHNDAPSPFLCSGVAPLYRFNHWSIFTRDFDRDLSSYLSLGYTEAFYAEFVSEDDGAIARIVYLDTVKQLGGYLELMEKSPPVIYDSYKKILAR